MLTYLTLKMGGELKLGKWVERGKELVWDDVLDEYVPKDEKKIGFGD